MWPEVMGRGGGVRLQEAEERFGGLSTVTSTMICALGLMLEQVSWVVR